MKVIDLIIKTEIAKNQKSLMLELLGKYRGKLTKEIEDDMREYANDLGNEAKNSSIRTLWEI